jgi:hypothetical protein
MNAQGLLNLRGHVLHQRIGLHRGTIVGNIGSLQHFNLPSSAHGAFCFGHRWRLRPQRSGPFVAIDTGWCTCTPWSASSRGAPEHAIDGVADVFIDEHAVPPDDVCHRRRIFVHQWHELIRPQSFCEARKFCQITAMKSYGP